MINRLQKIPIFSCKQSTRLGSRSLDEPLTFRERCWLIFHMLICRSCRGYRNEVAQMRKAFQHDCSSHSHSTLSSDAKARIKRNLSE